MKTLFILLFVLSWGVALTAQTANEEWVAIFQAQADSSGGMFFVESPEANDMAIDNSGNVYVTGRSKPLGTTTYDCVTIKYDASGTEQWVATYAGSGNWDDRSKAIVVDNSGNVYVTGESRETVGSDNYCTIKYDASGTEQWVALYDNGNSDYAASIAIDNSGNIYVTGRSNGGSTGTDFCTIKYDASTGTQLWVARYDGGGSPGANGDYGRDIAIDNSGNVYVVGTSRGVATVGNDICAIKYNASGVQQWVYLYNNPATDNTDGGLKIAVDNSGVYVLGNTHAFQYGYDDYCTIKINPSTGLEEWVNIYNGAANDWGDVPKAIGLDGSNNVYVTGWVAASDGNGYDYETVKYDASGTEQWVAIYHGDGGGAYEGAANDLVVDNSGNVYVTGKSKGFTSENYVTIKYDGPTGTQTWLKSYNGTADTADIGSAIAVDDAGNVYVTGLNMDSWIYQNFATIKYSQTIVPVELTSFTAVANNDVVELRWMTATELNNKGFEVERTQESGLSSPNWERIGYVPGFGTTTEPRVYSYTDNNVSSGNYTYRLKQIDYDGTFEYSPEVEVTVSVPGKFTLEQNYPNPFNPSTTIKYSLPVNGYVSLTVYNSVGQVVDELVRGQVKAGIHEVEFNASTLTSGIYFYKFVTSNYIDVKKMILLR